MLPIKERPHSRFLGEQANKTNDPMHLYPCASPASPSKASYDRERDRPATTPAHGQSTGRSLMAPWPLAGDALHAASEGPQSTVKFE